MLSCGSPGSRVEAFAVRGPSDFGTTLKTHFYKLALLWIHPCSTHLSLSVHFTVFIYHLLLIPLT